MGKLAPLLAGRAGKKGDCPLSTFEREKRCLSPFRGYCFSQKRAWAWDELTHLKPVVQSESSLHRRLHTKPPAEVPKQMPDWQSVPNWHVMPMSVNPTCLHSEFADTAEPSSCSAPMKHVRPPCAFSEHTHPAGHCPFDEQPFVQMNDPVVPMHTPDAQSDSATHGLPRSGKSRSPHAAVGCCPMHTV